jgi:hypothetical protein
METNNDGLRGMMPAIKKPRKRAFGKAKYPIPKLAAGESVTIPIESPEAERRLRKSADNWNARNKGFINARKSGDEITFTRWR